MTEIEQQRLEGITAQIGERFQDYLLIVRPDKHQMLVCSSDMTWAVGASKRFITLVDCDDRRHNDEGLK